MTCPIRGALRRKEGPSTDGCACQHPAEAMLVITAPPDLDAFEIGSDYILGVWTDDLDVEYARLYALLPGA